MLKILYISQFSEIGGGESSLLYILKKLNKKKFQPIVLLPKPGQFSDQLKKINVQIYYLDLPAYFLKYLFFPGLSPKGIYQLLALTKQLKPNIIHINQHSLSIYAGIVGKLLNIPVVATSHGIWDSYYFFQDLIAKAFISKILASTSKIQQKLIQRRLIDPKKIILAPLGIDTDYFKPLNKLTARKKLGLRLKPTEILVTIVARLDPIKDHLTFLNACSIVQKNSSNIKFLIVGSIKSNFAENTKINSSYLKIQNYLQANLNLKKTVFFKDFIENMPLVYSASDILVSSSLSESFGLTLLEAGACQVPVVSTNIGGQSLIVKNNQTGFLVKPQNPEALAEKVLFLAKNAALRKKMGKLARLHILARFPISQYILLLEQIYLEENRSDLTKP